MTSDASYRESHTKPGKAVAYDSHFEYRHRAFLWSREQLILKSIRETYLGDHDYDYLDFACGTGRILSHMEGYAKNSTGVDVSPEMLSETRKKVKKSELIEADLTRSQPLGDRRFDLITAFRFFLNAEASLRESVMGTLGQLLSDDGYLVFNNHMNRYSAIAIALKLYGSIRGKEVRTWTLREIHALAGRSGLEVVAVYHTGVIPGFEWIMLLPRPISAAVESVFSRIGILRHVAQVQVVVCRRVTSR